MASQEGWLLVRGLLVRGFTVHVSCLQLCACAVLGTGIWLAVDRSFMATISGEMIYAAAIYLMLAGKCEKFAEVLQNLHTMYVVVQNICNMISDKK